MEIGFLTFLTFLCLHLQVLCFPTEPPTSPRYPPFAFSLRLLCVKYILGVSKQTFTQVYISTIKQNRGTRDETCKTVLWPLFM